MATTNRLAIDKEVNDTIEIATNIHFKDLENYISKDKIKEKIKEAEFYITNIDFEEGNAMYKVLKELLEE